MSPVAAFAPVLVTMVASSAAAAVLVRRSVQSHLNCEQVCRLSCGDHETPRLTLKGGDGEGAFTVEWRLDLETDSLAQSLFEHPEPETAIVTRYALGDEGG